MAWAGNVRRGPSGGGTSRGPHRLMPGRPIRQAGACRAMRPADSRLCTTAFPTPCARRATYHSRVMGVRRVRAAKIASSVSVALPTTSDLTFAHSCAIPSPQSVPDTGTKKGDQIMLQTNGRVFVALRKGGVKNRGFPSPVYHAVTPHMRMALCGTEPGSGSGWAEPPSQHVTCPICRQRLMRLQADRVEHGGFAAKASASTPNRRRQA